MNKRDDPTRTPSDLDTIRLGHHPCQTPSHSDKASGHQRRRAGQGVSSPGVKLDHSGLVPSVAPLEEMHLSRDFLEEMHLSRDFLNRSKPQGGYKALERIERIPVTA